MLIIIDTKTVILSDSWKDTASALHILKIVKRRVSFLMTNQPKESVQIAIGTLENESFFSDMDGKFKRPHGIHLCM